VGTIVKIFFKIKIGFYFQEIKNFVFFFKCRGFRGFYARKYEINRITTDGDIDLQTEDTFWKLAFVTNFKKA